MKTQTNKQSQGASNIKMVKYKKNWWTIKTRKERSEYGQDYKNEYGQDYQTSVTSTPVSKSGECPPD